MLADDQKAADLLCFTAVVRLQVQAAFFEYVSGFEGLGHHGGALGQLPVFGLEGGDALELLGGLAVGTEQWLPATGFEVGRRGVEGEHGVGLFAWPQGDKRVATHIGGDVDAGQGQSSSLRRPGNVVL